MNRHAVQTAFGRVAARTTTTTPAAAQCLFQTTPRTFSTTATSQSDDSTPTRNPSKPLDTSGRERSVQAASKLGALIRTRTQERMRGDSAPVDARSLGARPGGPDGPKVINLRSLRDRNATGGSSFVGRGDGLSPARGGFVRSGSAPRFGGTRFGAPPGTASGNTGRTRFGAGGARGGGGARGRGNSRGGGRGGSSRGGDRNGGKKKDDRLNDKPVDREWSNAEMKVLDRLDQGELTPYTPHSTLEALLGYGPAIATDNALGKMESAMRSMRMMGGGQAFDNDATSTVDTKAFARRYLHDKKPIFFNTKEEKEWLERSLKGMKIAGPVHPIKQAVLETTVMGKYTAPEFKEIKDVAGTMANYHSRDASYRASHSLEFAEKVLSILPGQVKGGDGKAARA